MSKQFLILNRVNPPIFTLICFSFILFTSLLAGCNIRKPSLNSPQAVLSEYVTLSMSMKSLSEKVKLLKLTSGDARKMLENLDEEKFRAFFLDTRREFVSLKIRDERDLAPTRHTITYEITYKSHSPNSDDLITLKKHAVLDRIDGSWLISEVQNLKTNIEHENALSF